MEACKQRESKKVKVNDNQSYIKCECGVTLQERSWSWHSMTNKHQDFVNEKYPNEIREYAKRMKIKRKGDYLKYRHFKTFVVADK